MLPFTRPAPALCFPLCRPGRRIHWPLAVPLYGSVRNWGDEGVDLGTFGARNCRMEGALASGNTGNDNSGGAAPGSTDPNANFTY